MGLNSFIQVKPSRLGGAKIFNAPASARAHLLFKTNVIAFYYINGMLEILVLDFLACRSLFLYNSWLYHVKYIHKKQIYLAFYVLNLYG